MGAWLFTILRVANWWDPRSKVCDLWLGGSGILGLWSVTLSLGSGWIGGSVALALTLVCGMDGWRPWPWCLGDNGEPNGGVELW